MTIKDFNHTIASLNITLEGATTANPDLTLSVSNSRYQVVITAEPAPVLLAHH
jgi:hypothetical protein